MSKSGPRKYLDHKRMRMRRCERMQEDASDPLHGTSTGYQYGCRCERCAEAGRAMWARRKAVLRDA